MSITLKKADGDIVHQDSNGRPYYVEGVEKLSQDVADAVMTLYVNDRGWGAQLTDLVGKAMLPGTLEPVGAAMIQQTVQDAMNRLIKKQASRPDQLSEYEAVEKFNVQVFTINRTSYTFVLEVTPVAGPDQSPLAFQIKLGHQMLATSKQNLPGMSNI